MVVGDLNNEGMDRSILHQLAGFSNSRRADFPVSVLRKEEDGSPPKHQKFTSFVATYMKTRLFTTETSRNVGLGGPWYFTF